MDDQRLAILGQFTPEGKLTPGYGDSYLFLVGRDDVHGILNFLIPQEKLSFKFNMFGYDDDALNTDIIKLFNDPNCHVQASLDRSQAGGIHEKAIIALDEQTDPTEFSNSFVILESATDQISHTKGGVFVGQGIYFEGSTNWSNSGEGTGISLKPGVNSIPGYKAQNNTLLVSTNHVNLSRFSVQLDVEHTVGLQQKAKKSV
jgi:hypothetical protein